MVSLASGGKADRIAARTLVKVRRAGSGILARYSSTLFGARLPFAAELRLPDFAFLMRAMLQKAPIQVYRPQGFPKRRDRVAPAPWPRSEQACATIAP